MIKYILLDIKEAFHILFKEIDSDIGAKREVLDVYNMSSIQTVSDSVCNFMNLPAGSKPYNNETITEYYVTSVDAGKTCVHLPFYLKIFDLLYKQYISIPREGTHKISMVKMEGYLITLAIQGD